MASVYQTLTHSRRIEKDVHRILGKLNQQQRKTLESILRNDPKGTTSTHWKIKKVKKDVWQCDLVAGYRMSYTVIDKPTKTVLILFAGSHDAAAIFLRRRR